MKSTELAFFGKITAGATHEMKNVLAIIRESGGLMEDLLAMTPEGAFPYSERFLKAVSAIDSQVKRGVEILNRLNRFAHSVDEPVCEITLREHVEQAALLNQRFARLKTAEIELKDGGEPIVLRTSPFMLQMVLSAGFQCCFEAMPGGGRILVSIAGTAREPAVSLSCEPASGETKPDMESLCATTAWPGLCLAASEMGGSVRESFDGPGFSIFLKQEQD